MACRWLVACYLHGQVWGDFRVQKITGAAALALALMLAAGRAGAGVYADDLSKCLVKSTSPEDQTDFVAWAFSAMSAHPAVKVYSSITDAQRVELNKRVAALYERLMAVDCRPQTVAAIKYEGTAAIGQGFSVLGQVAFRGLMEDPAVAGTISSMNKYMDMTKFEALAKEAGVAQK
jgi:hypothetical protein